MATENMNERLRKYIMNLSASDKLVYCRKQITNVIRDFKAKEKSSLAELNYNGDRKGQRGGRQTYLSAKATNQAQAYFKSLEDLKLILKYL